MVWFRVDDTLAAHPKARRAGLPALGMWTVAGSWSSQQLTDGFVPDWYADTWPQGRKLAAALVAAGMWHEPGHDCDRCPQPVDGWQFHDWTDQNPTRADIESERDRLREVRARAGRAGGVASGRSRRAAANGRSTEANAKQVASTVRSKTQATERSPDPTRITSGYQSPPGTEVDARDPNGGGRLADLVDQVRAVRPFWNPHAIADAARRCADTGRGYHATLAALLTVADDPATVSPHRVVADGPWWRPPTERGTRSTTDERVAAGLALAAQLAAQLAAEARRAELHALPGGAA